MLNRINHPFFKKIVEIEINKNNNYSHTKIREIFDPIINFIFEKYDKNIIKNNINIDFNQRTWRYWNCSLVSKEIITYIIKNNFITTINKSLNIKIKKIWLVKIDTILLNNIRMDSYHVATILVYENWYIFLDFSWSQFNYLIHNKKQWLPEFYIWINIYPTIFKDKTILPIYKICYNNNNNINWIKLINNLERISPYTSYNILERFDDYINL